MFLEGRPPVNVGVTSSGDVFGGTQITLQRRARRQAVQPVRRVDLAVPHVRRLATSNLSRRFQYALQGYSQTQFFYGQLDGVFYDPAFSGVHRPRPRAWRRARSAAAARSRIYPFNRYRRVEVSAAS